MSEHPPREPDLPEAELPSRPARRRLIVATGFLAGLAGVLVGGPAAVLFAAPLFRERGPVEEQWIPLGPADAFPEGQVTATEYPFQHQDGWYRADRSRSVAVRRETDGEFTIFSSTCTHLGCAIRWEADAQQFVCPCHNGIFDPEGRPIAGPPERPLDRLQSRVNPTTNELEVREA